MDPGDEAYVQLCETLRQEASEQVEAIGAALLRLERGVSGAERTHAIDEAFRQAHNLKGAASSLGFSLTAKLAHALESVLGQLPNREGDAARHAFDLLHQGLTAVVEALAADPGADSHPNVTPIIERLSSIHRSSPTTPPGGDAAGKKPAVPSPPPSPSPQPQGRAPDEEDISTGRREGTDYGGTRVARPPATGHHLEGATLSSHDPEPAEPRTRIKQDAPSAPVLSGEESQEFIRRVVEQEETLRVSVRKLNALMTQVGELLSARLRTDQRLAELRTLLHQEEGRLEREAGRRASLRDGRGDAGGVPPEVASYLLDGMERQQNLVRQLRDLVRTFEADALHSSILSGELQEDIRRIQTFPLASVLDPLPRAVRNMAMQTGKEIDLTIKGAEIELDKKVLAALRDPIYHLLRNAVDHGVEEPEQRLALRKPERGSIEIRAEHRGSSIVITVSDDGPGVDLDRVRDKAVSLGLCDADKAKELSEHRLLDFLFAPGMTTRRAATGMSGRGVGMDAVRTMIENLHGTVTIESRMGRGTTVSIVLPLTIYVVHALIVRTAERRLALPISAVQRILRISPEDVVMVERSEAIVLDGHPVALLPLAGLLGEAVPEDTKDSPFISVIVVGAGDTRFALAVEEIVGDETLLAKNLEPPLHRVRNVAGASILGDGRVILMLNPVDLMKTASAREQGALPMIGRSAAETVAAVRLLLADDSFTTRTLERSVLEMAGFDVTACADGQEALDTLREAGPFDAVVSDVNMPRMTGLELCAKVREDGRFQDLPFVLVTSLASPEDRRRGMEVGANAYIVKSEFDHEKLVATVKELLGRM